MARSEDVTPKILEKIHREIQKTNQGLGELRHEVSELRSDTNRRLDFLSEASTRTNTELASIKKELVGVKEGLGRVEKVVERNGARFEHALLTQGETHRTLEARVARLEARAGIEP
jgi:hypothetical protein